MRPSSHSRLLRYAIRESLARASPFASFSPREQFHCLNSRAIALNCLAGRIAARFFPLVMSHPVLIFGRVRRSPSPPLCTSALGIVRCLLRVLEFFPSLRCLVSLFLPSLPFLSLVRFRAISNADSGYMPLIFLRRGWDRQVIERF